MDKVKCLLAMAICATFCSCGLYQMPTEDDFQKKPTTNNPRVVGDKGRNDLVPGVSY